MTNSTLTATQIDKSIRLLIVDDQPLIRRGLSMMLASEDGITVVGEADNGQAAIDLALEQEPDVVVMDLQMPVLSGVAATRAITRQLPRTHVVVLTTFDHDELVFEAVQAGARAYLLKDAPEDEVLATIRAVNRGESRLSPTVARKVLEQFRRLMPAPLPPGGRAQATVGSIASDAPGPGFDRDTDEPLTAKEERVLQLIAQGLSNRQIANTVFLAEGTIKNYVSRIMDKLHARSRTELAVRAVSRESKQTPSAS